MPASVPHMVMRAFKGTLEEKPPFLLKGMTVRKVSSQAKVRYALALKIIYHDFFFLLGYELWNYTLHKLVA
jgi:hypothetical protein